MKLVLPLQASAQLSNTVASQVGTYLPTIASETRETEENHLGSLILLSSAQDCFLVQPSWAICHQLELLEHSLWWPANHLPHSSKYTHTGLSCMTDEPSMEWEEGI